MARGRKATRAATSPRSPRSRRFGFEGSGLRQAIIWLVSLKIAGLVLAFDADGYQAFDLPKSLLSRAVAWLLAALIVVALLRFGLSVIPRSRLFLSAAAFLVANILSVLLAEDRYTAVYGEQARYLGLTFILDMLVLVVAVAVAFRSARDWLVPFTCFLVATAATLTYAALQFSGHDPTHWGDDPRVRPFATLGNPDMFGHFLSTAFGLGLGVAAFPPGGSQRTFRVCGGVLAVLALGAGGVVATRGLLLGVVAALVAVPAIYLRVRGIDRSAAWRLALGALFAASLLGLVLAISPLGARIRYTLTEGANTADRILLYETAVEMFASRPVLGYGPDNFGIAYPGFRPRAGALTWGPNVPQSSAHNWVLQSAVTTGTIGLLGILGVIASTVWSLFGDGLRRLPQVAGPLLVMLAAYLAHGLVSVGSIGVDWALWMALGGAIAISALRSNQTSESLRVGPLPQMLLITLGLVGSLSGMSAFRANRDVEHAQLAWRAKQGDAAIAAARSATQADSGRADYWNWLGLSFDLRTRYEEALEAYARAAGRSPHTATYWMNEARTEARLALLGDRASDRRITALADARRAIDEDPNEPSWHAALGEIQVAFMQYGDALASVVTAIEIFPKEPSWDQTAAAAAMKIDDVTLSRSLLERALASRESAALRVALGRVALKANDRELARASALRALALEPTNVEAQRLLADTSP